MYFQARTLTDVFRFGPALLCKRKLACVIVALNLWDRTSRVADGPTYDGVGKHKNTTNDRLSACVWFDALDHVCLEKQAVRLAVSGGPGNIAGKGFLGPVDGREVPRRKFNPSSRSSWMQKYPAEVGRVCGR